MTRTPRDVTDAELAVLQALWDQQGATIREIAALLNPQQQDSYYATVKKLLERLEQKGFVRRRPQGNAYRYEALVSREELVGRRLREVADSLCEGSLTPLLTQLAQHEQLSKEQQQALYRLIEELSDPPPVSRQVKKKR